jgi:ferredoxin
MNDDQTFSSNSAQVSDNASQPTPVPPNQPLATYVPPSPPPGTPPVVMSTTYVGKYKVEVINDKCIGAASCAAIAPRVFEMNEDNIAVVISQDGEEDDIKLLAAQSCPTAAIIVTDTETGKQVWPLDM